MSDIFWSLPGPATFLDEVMTHLRAGASVVLATPREPPDGLRREVLARLRDEERWMVRSIDVGEPDARATAPARLLHDLWSPTPLQLVGGGTVAAAPGLAGTVVYVTGLHEAVASSWWAFLAEFTEAVRARSIEQRPALVVEARGLATLPRGLVALAVLLWRGCMTRLEVEWLASSLLPVSSGSAMRRRLIASIVAELAGHDVELAVRLCSVGLGALCEPTTLLREEARRRGWDARREPSWEDGTLDEIDGRRYVHSALLAVRGDTAELSRRIWRAQMRVLLPAIEERRLELLQRLRPQIKLPLSTRQGMVVELEAIEIGVLSWLAESLAIDYPTRRELQRLASARNALAHGRPLAADDVPPV